MASTAGIPSTASSATVTSRTERPRSVKSPDLRREELLDTARQLFEAQGIRATNFGDIAARAGVTRGLIYHYFGDKRTLVDEVLAGYVADFSQAVRDWDAARTPGDVDGALASCIELFRGGMRDTAPLRRSLEQAEDAGLYNTFLDQVVAALVDCLQDTTVRAYARLHRVEISHVRATFTVLVYGLIALVRTHPHTPNDVLQAIVHQTLHLDSGGATIP